MFDLLVKNAQDLKGNPLEIAVKSGKIVDLGEHLQGKAKEVFDAEGAYVSAGWIDSHVHCFEKMDLYYDYPDEIGVATGVTTVIDAGSSGEANIKDFYELAKKAKTNVLALLNISKHGIVTQDELSDLSLVDEAKNMERIKELPEFIVGIKARMSKTVIGQNGIVPLQMAKKLQSKVNLPLMVHIGSAPPKLEDVLQELEAGDIVTHCFNGKENGILATSDEIKDFALEAYRRGIIFDIGHGTDSFNFKVAQVAREEEVSAQSISTDIYIRNRKNGPVYDLATTLSKLLKVGYSLEELISAVTTAPAKNFNLANKGSLEVGKDGDLTFFKLEDKQAELVDSNGNIQQSEQLFSPVACTVAGILYHEREKK
ncbi:amidohydrolase/deacetylase family metallohydrolase [Lactococcus ileimucosae]|uniref:amidohydrolase/deacetylase family metallohydrolase n=1 Tax=Lactococcus ileimucosae TaxID=2941329 RepID=UPI003517BD0F